MRFRALTLLTCVWISAQVFAQTNTFPSSGNVGVGTTTPTTLFQVNGGTSQFGGAVNYARFLIDGDLTLTGTADYLVGGDRYAFRYSGNQNFGLYFSASNSRFEFRDGSASQIFWITGAGNAYIKKKLHIGSTATPGASLEITPSNAAAIRVNAFGTSAGNTGEMRFQELSANGTNYVGFKAPDAITTNTVWVLPQNDGISGQILRTNGAGVLSWVNDTNTIYTAGSGLSLISNVFTNTAPDQIVSLLGGGIISISGTYPNFTISALESDPVFNASPASAITTGDITHWNDAYNWGDHADAGYLTSYTETDPLYTASLAADINATDTSNWNAAYGWGDHAEAGYLTSYTETDPLFNASLAADITVTDTSNWNAAYNWGDHALEGYLTEFTESDPIYNASPASGISSTDIVNWNDAYNWGDHAEAGYLTEYIETDPLFNASLAADITATDTSNWNAAYGWGDHAEAGYLTEYTETDPLFNASLAADITGTDTSNWNAAYGWGDHAEAGYLTEYTETDPQVGSNNLNYIPKWNGTQLVDGSIYDNGTNIGIGTNTPTYKLQVTEDVSFNQVRVGRGTGSNTYNTLVGDQALSINSSGTYNTAVGWTSMMNNTGGHGNTAVGASTLKVNTTGESNTAMGNASLANNTTGHSNSGFGSGALLYNTTGVSNVASGVNALHYNATGNNNTAVGFVALRNSNASNNTALGYQAGFNNTTGQGNVFLGYDAGYNETGSNKLYIANSATNPPLIYGDFATAKLGLGTITPEAKLHVVGDVKIVDGTQGAGKVLTSDASGLASWQAVSYTETDPQVSSTTTNKIPKWNGTTLTDGQLYDDGSFIGIGTTTGAGERLVVNGGGVDGRIATFQNSYDDKVISLGQVLTDNGGYIRYRLSTNHIGIGVHGHTEQIVLNGAGNVGIGTTNPTYKLEVTHDMLVNGIPIGKGTGSSAYNVRMGQNNLSMNTSGEYNTALGTFSLMRNTTGSSNTAAGYAALYFMNTGSENTGLGNGALYANTSGSYNVAIGEGAGRENLGSSNVFLGYYAGFNESGSNKLYIANSSANPPLIYGDFATAKLGLGTINPDAKLHVVGDVKIVDGTQGAGKVLTSDANGLASWQAVSYTETDPQVSSATMNKVPKWNGSTLADGIIYDNGSRIGINTVDPQYSVDVNIGTTPGTSAFRIHANAGGNAVLYFGDGDVTHGMTGDAPTDVFGKIVAASDYGGLATIGFTELANVPGIMQYGVIGSEDPADSIAAIELHGFRKNGTYYQSMNDNETVFGVKNGWGKTRFAIKGSGKVGVNTLDPQAQLHVQGNLMIADGTQGTGKVLTSDASGLASWQVVTVTESDPQVSSATTNKVPKWNGTTLVDGLIYDNGTNVGIGTTSPSKKLTVMGGDIYVDGVTIGRGSGTGEFNTAVGAVAQYLNTTGTQNTALGCQANYSNTTGSYNTAIGTNASFSNPNANYNTTLGFSAGAWMYSGFTNAMALGANSVLGGSNTVRVGDGSITSIGGQVSWTSFSDERIKKDIRSNVPGLEFINQLKPVTYHIDLTKQNELMGIVDTLQRDGKYDIENINFTGFLAQEVDEAAQRIGYDFSGIDKTGSIMGLRYSDFVVPLTKAAQELDATNKDQDDEIAALQATITQMQEQIEELTELIQSGASNDGAAAISIGAGSNAAVLGQNIPNPYDQTTLIPFRIPKNCNDAYMMITDQVAGRVVTVIPISCNETHIVFEAGELPSGAYTYSLFVDGQLIGTKEMILTR